MSEMKERSWRRDERMTELFVKDARVRSGRRILIANLAFRKRGKREREKDGMGETERDTLSFKSQNGKTVVARGFSWHCKS